MLGKIPSPRNLGLKKTSENSATHESAVRSGIRSEHNDALSSLNMHLIPHPGQFSDSVLLEAITKASNLTLSSKATCVWNPNLSIVGGYPGSARAKMTGDPRASVYSRELARHATYQPIHRLASSHKTLVGVREHRP
jgi:hypothetical protein